jgi:hypothetical protein
MSDPLSSDSVQSDRACTEKISLIRVRDDDYVDPCDANNEFVVSSLLDAQNSLHKFPQIARHSRGNLPFSISNSRSNFSLQSVCHFKQILYIVLIKLP